MVRVLTPKAPMHACPSRRGTRHRSLSSSSATFPAYSWHSSHHIHISALYLSLSLHHLPIYIYLPRTHISSLSLSASSLSLSLYTIFLCISIYLWCEDTINTASYIYSLSPLFPTQMSFILSLGFVFTIMINFCMKSVHALLRFANSKDNRKILDKPIFHDPNTIPSPAAGGLGFVTFSGDIHQPTNAAAATKLPDSSFSPSPGGSAAAADATLKKDPGGIGFLDEIGGSVDGLMSCTESLGFESSDERRVDVVDPIERINNDGGSRTTTSEDRTKSTRTAVKKSGGDEVVKKFPPPISLLSHTGKPTFFLRPVRKDGRLELTEVKIAHREILQASREDGRLRLNLVRDIDMDQDQADNPKENFEDTDEKEDEEEKQEGEEEETGQLFPVTNGGSDRQWRCHELMSRHLRRHNLHHEWSKPCVTIR